MGKYGVTAKLVWDGGKDLFVPEEMGKPREDQLQGTVGERLSEIGGRICYDSCGTGRSSEDFHPHILSVGHYSVYEHHNVTAELEVARDCQTDFLLVCANRPGLWIEPYGQRGFRLTLNARVLLDWKAWDKSSGWWRWETGMTHILTRHLHQALTETCHVQHWPRIVPLEMSETKGYLTNVRLIAPVADEEKWISVYMSGSRGFSHELVRHGDRTAISQRSTRFVDESESPWIDHPLVQEFMKEASNYDRESMRVTINEVEDPAKSAYEYMVEKLQPWLVSKGVDKLTARKQARGAARGYLGNALQTEVIFSASVGQWKRMLRMRACAAADAEIRAVFVQALAALQTSSYKGDFERFKLVPSPDGMGQCAVEES